MMDKIEAKSRNFTSALEIRDNGGRRSGIDRRRFSYDGYIPERRLYTGRRMVIDRRSGSDRRGGRDRRINLDRRRNLTRERANKGKRSFSRILNRRAAEEL